MEASYIAHFLAKGYKISLNRPANCGLVHVLDNCVLDVVDEANEESVLKILYRKMDPPSPDTTAILATGTRTR
jgi:hypothetical protein